MHRYFRIAILTIALLGGASMAKAFSLLGPVEEWQTRTLGYNFGSDIGAVKNIGEEYRWNTPVLTYGFDESFLNYFGTNGIAEVNKAVAIINGVFSNDISGVDLNLYPLESQRINYKAEQLRIHDLKSYALGVLVEELGLAEPERYVFTLRDRKVTANNTITNFVVIQRNFDPFTYEPSSYINNRLYWYDGFIETSNPNWNWPDNQLVDPLAYPFISTVAGKGQSAGLFYTGLTRDDVGGLKYSYRTNNYNVERLIPGTQEVFTNTMNPATITIYDLGLLVKESVGTTNRPADIQNQFPGIQFASTNTYFTNIVETNITSFFTNFPYTVHQVFLTNYTTNVFQVFDYTYANVVTNEYFPTRTVTERVYEVVPPPNYVPNGGNLQTNIISENTYTVNEPSGSFYILPGNVIDILFTTNSVTTVDASTNSFQLIVGDVVAVTNTAATNINLTTLDYYALYTNSVATTNTVQDLLAIPGYEDLLILSTNSYLGTVVTTNILSYFINYPWNPEQAFFTNYVTNVVTLHDYTIGNIIVDPFYPAEIGRPVQVTTYEILPGLDYSPGLPILQTNILESYADTQFVPNGEFYVVPTNLLGYAISQHIHTQVNSSTNVDFLATGNVLLRTNDTAVLVIATDLSTFHQQATTNSPQDLLAIYPDLLILSSNRVFVTQVETNFVDVYLTNEVWHAGGFPILTQQYVLTTNVATNWTYTFGNVITNFGSDAPIRSNGLFEVHQDLIGYHPYAPAGGPPLTNQVILQYFTNLVGNIYVVPTNLFAYSLAPEEFFLALTVPITNTITYTNLIGEIEQTNTIHFIRYTTNVFVAGYPVELLGTNDFGTNDIGIRKEIVSWSTNNTYQAYPIEMVTVDDLTNRVFGRRHEVITYYTNTTVSAHIVGVRDPQYGVALRGGIGSITLVPINGGSIFGTNSLITNTYIDSVIVSNAVIQQTLRRVTGAPDILFAAADLGFAENSITPNILDRSVNFDNGNDINGDVSIAGPGLLRPQVLIRFSKLGAFIVNYHQGPSYFLDQVVPDFVWGSFDGSTNTPTLYPSGLSITELEQRVLGGQ